MAEYTDLGIPPSESINRIWRPLSPFLLFGWKTAIWIIEMVYLFTFLYTLYTVQRTLRGIPFLLIGFYFAAAPLQADQQIFIDYVSIVTGCIDELWNIIFRPIVNDLILCIKPVCCLYNYIVNVLRFNAKLFLDYYRGLLIQNMPELLETNFGIPASTVTEIMDYLDLTLPPNFPCDASGGGTSTYVQCVIDQLTQGQPSPDILDCRGFVKYKETMSEHYGVPYEVLIHAFKRDGKLTTDGVMESYVKMNVTENDSISQNEFGDVSDNEWGIYRVRSARDTSAKIKQGGSGDKQRSIHLREVRTRVEEGITWPSVYNRDGMVPREISSFFPGFESGDEYAIAVLEVSCLYFHEYFEIFWEILLGVFFTVYDIAWNFLQYVIDSGFDDFLDFFVFLFDYIINVLLDIPCLDFSSGPNFAVSLVNCPCQLFADELGFTYFPAVGDDEDTYLAALFSCVGLDCAVDGSGVATVERFFTNCVIENYVDFICDDDGDCDPGSSCQNKIFFDSIDIDFGGLSWDVDFDGWCLPNSKRNIMAKVYVEKIRMEEQLGATAFGAPDNSSVEYWKYMRETATERYIKRGEEVPDTLEQLVQKEFNDTMEREAIVWLRKHSPNRDYWRRLKSRSDEVVANEQIILDGKTKFNGHISASTFIEKADISPWKKYANLVGRRYFNKFDSDAAKIGPSVHNVDWNTYDAQGRLLTVNGIKVKTNQDEIYQIAEGDEDYITPSSGIEDTQESMEDMTDYAYEDGGTSEGLTRMQVMLRAFSDIIQDNMKIMNTVTWDPIEYTFNTPSPSDMKHMFDKLKTKEKYGAAMRHLSEGAKEQKKDLMEKGMEVPAGMAQFATTIKLLVTRFMAPRLLGNVSRELESRSPVFAAAVKRTLPSLTEGHEVDKLVEEIELGNTKIWDMHRYTKILRRQELNMLKNNTYRWAINERKNHFRKTFGSISEYMRNPSADERILSFGGEPTIIQKTVTQRLPVVGAVFSVIIPLLKNPKLLATGVAPFLTSRYGQVISYNVLRTMSRPLGTMYSEGLVNTLGNPTLLQEFAEDFGFTILNNIIFLIEEGFRLLLCNWWGIVINAISGAVGAILWYIPYFGQTSYIVLGFINALGSGLSLTFGYCPPKPVLDNFIPVDLPWNYLFNLIDCDPETMCRVADDCISNAPCRCRRTAQYESFFWEFTGDRDGPPCEDGGGMPTGNCLCWPNLPCDFAFPELNLNKPFSGNCKDDFGYRTSAVATWQNPGFVQWFRAIAINWYKSSQFLTRAVSQGRKRYLSDTLGYLLMVITLGIAAVGLRTRWWILALLIWLVIMFVWDLWNEVLERWVVPKADSITDQVIIGPIMKFFLSWIRFPNYTSGTPLGDLRDGEFTCWVFNTPSLSMATGGGISIATIIYALWVAGTFFYFLQYISYLLLIIPTAWFYGSESQLQQDAELEALERELEGLEGIEGLEDIENTALPSQIARGMNASETFIQQGRRPLEITIEDPSRGPVTYYVPDHHKGE